MLLDAAYDTSPRDLRANWRPVVSLVLFCVVVTVAAVAIVARVMVPDMPWAAAIALGAIVAPPDATAATSILRLIAPPHRILVVLEGESLLNDASALLIYRVAVGIAMGATFAPATALPTLALTLLGGGLVGYAFGWVVPRIMRRIEDIPVNIVMQFVGTFAVWLIAERFGLSPIITVVVYAVTIAQGEAAEQGAEHRRASFAVWDVAVYVLNALAFILIGLQLRAVIENVGDRQWFFLSFAMAILATVIVARVLWVFLYNRGWSLQRWVSARRGVEAEQAPSWRVGLVVGWCGMRGIVTLATALALPYGDRGEGFPYRDLLIAAAFMVVLGTLVIQGLTLGPLLRWLKLRDDGEVGREERLARREAMSSAVRALEHRPEAEAASLRDEYQARLREEQGDTSVRDKLRFKAIAAERSALNRLRRSRTIGDAAFRTVEEEIDREEGHAAGLQRAVVEPPGAPKE